MGRFFDLVVSEGTAATLSVQTKTWNPAANDNAGAFETANVPLSDLTNDEVNNPDTYVVLPGDTINLSGFQHASISAPANSGDFWYVKSTDGENWVGAASGKAIKGTSGDTLAEFTLSDNIASLGSYLTGSAGAYVVDITLNNEAEGQQFTYTVGAQSIYVRVCQYNNLTPEAAYTYLTGAEVGNSFDTASHTAAHA